MSDRVCAVVGVGPGNGMSIARRFASEGYKVALLARRADALEAYAGEISGSRPFVCDASDGESVTRAFAAIEQELGPVDVLAYNAGSGLWGKFDEVDVATFESSWKVNVFGLLHAARAVVPGMRARGSGAIAVVGAGASWRGRPMTAAFAQAKAAQRSLAQSLARQLGPEGIHVCYAILDGVVDLPATRAWMADKPDEFFVQPDDLAEAIYHVVQQKRSAWTFEFDLRPHVESW